MAIANNARKRATSPNAESEYTPLLVSSEAGPKPTNDARDSLRVNNNNNDEEYRSFPTAQIYLLSFARLIDPIAYFSIFPFVNQMLWETGNLNQANVGFYSGLIESLFSLTQMIFMIPVGRAADRFGRKPVLVWSMIGLSLATTAFGFSKHIWQMILARCIAGMFSGDVVTIRTMISENCTPKTQAWAYSFYSFAYTIGVLLGPIIGGLLAKPATEYPSVFGNVKFFVDFPYALPTIASGLFGAITVIATVCFIRETLTPERRAENKSSTSPDMSTWELLKHPGVGNIMYIYGHLMLVTFAYTALFPVISFTMPKLGGFGLSPAVMSLFLAGTAIAQALWTIAVFPPLQRRIGTSGILNVCSWGWAFTFCWPPICNILLRTGHTTSFWICASIITVQGAGAAMAFVGIQLAINDISPSPSTLGSLNALALAIVAGVRAFTPALFTSIFAVGVKWQILGGHFVWLILVILALGLCVGVRWLPEKANGKNYGKDIDDEEE